jgi:alkylhydroperoxidase/carboxymuconolactone decarboxylase family protein YurZ
MTTLEIVHIIGDALTQFDLILASPDFPTSDPLWQQTYALRKHLDDVQRQLVMVEIDASTPPFQQATVQLKAANEELKKIGTEIAKVASAISIAAQIAAVVDQLIGLAKK